MQQAEELYFTSHFISTPRKVQGTDKLQESRDKEDTILAPRGHYNHKFEGTWIGGMSTTMTVRLK